MYVLQGAENTIRFDPEYDFMERSQQAEFSHRTLAGNLYSYHYGGYCQFKFGVTFVNCEFKSIVNSWWCAKDSLLFFSEVNCTDVRTVIISNRRTPVNKFMKPYSDLWQGIIELSTY